MNLNLPKDWYKRADTYVYLLPAVAAVWALLAIFVFHPAGVRAWERRQREYEEAQEWIGKILDIEPQRLQYKETRGGSSEFDFTTEVDKFSKLFGIAPGNYTMNTQDVLKRAGKKSRSASISIKSADIETTTKFISALLIRWPDLQCEQLTLQRLNTGKNDWKVELKFTYYF